MGHSVRRRDFMSFSANTGINKLANVLNRRMKHADERPRSIDFGEIQGNGSLLTNTFPVPIPKGQYSVSLNSDVEIKSGDRVVVSWIGNEAVVIGILN